MLPSETMIWQPEFTDKTLSRKTGAVQLGLLSLERQQDSQPVNQQSEHEPEPASRVKRDLSEVEFESTMKRKRFM
ncbi:T3SS secreted effector IpaH [Escherichia coli]|nr:T3SS secreted effector IpaH [Escherichia coli]